MDAIKQLRAAARHHRDAAIAKAEQDYRRALKEIRLIERRLLREGAKPEPRTGPRTGTAAAHAEAVLRERGPLSLMELAVEVHGRGYQAKSEQALVYNLRNQLRLNPGLFWFAEGLWGVV